MIEKKRENQKKKKKREKERKEKWYGGGAAREWKKNKKIRFWHFSHRENWASCLGICESSWERVTRVFHILIIFFGNEDIIL